MEKLVLLIYAMTAAAYALPPVRPVLPPPSPYADTETVTNVAFGVTTEPLVLRLR